MYMVNTADANLQAPPHVYLYTHNRWLYLLRLYVRFNDALICRLIYYRLALCSYQQLFIAPFMQAGCIFNHRRGRIIIIYAHRRERHLHRAAAAASKIGNGCRFKCQRGVGEMLKSRLGGS